MQGRKTRYDYEYCYNLHFFYLMWYLINSFKLLSENPQPPPLSLKIPLPRKIQKVQVSHFCQHWKLFRPPPPPPPSSAERGWEGGGHCEFAKGVYNPIFKWAPVSAINPISIEWSPHPLHCGHWNSPSLWSLYQTNVITSCLVF